MPFFTHQNRRLFYREAGAGPLLLILHGNTASSALHQGELDFFGQHFHTVALDLWGCGQSQRAASWPLDWWQIAAADAAALAQRLGEPAFVLGTSGGAIAALWMAILRPAQVRAVIADSGLMRFAPGHIENEVRARRLKTPPQRAFWENAHGPDWEAVVEADCQFLLDVAAAGGELYHGRLAEIHTPVLLTASRADTLIPDCAARQFELFEHIPNARLYLSSTGDHPFLWSRADEFRPVALNFLKQAAANPSVY